MPAPIRISICKHADAPIIAGLESVCFTPESGQAPWSERSISSALESAGTHCLIAMDDNEAAGYAIAREVGAGEAELLRVAVRPEARRHGVARALIEEISNLLASRGCTELHLELRSANAPALALYEATGFGQTGRRTAYYGSGEDAILMKRVLAGEQQDGQPTR